jgi:iron complex outermembrane receptor protein
MIHRAILAGTALVLAISPSPWAAAADTSGGAGKDALEEITITAQRRAENAQDVPIALTALQGSELEGKAVSAIADLQYASPSLSIGTYGLTNAVNIRGVGLASGNPNVGNGVATYYDGLFQVPIVSTNQLYDIADVEVLRGPQGTLVGSNSTGGAIFMNTQSPKLGETAGYIRAGAGNYHGALAEGAVSLPVDDVLSFRLAGMYNSHESFYRSVGPAYTDAGSLYERSGRLGVLFKPGALQILGKVEYTERQTGGYASTPVPGSQYAPFAPTDPFDLAFDTPNLNHERGMISLVELRYELDNGLTLRSLSGYQDKNIHNLLDYDGTAQDTPADPQLLWDQHVRERQWTQEVNILSPTAGNYNWVAGAYFQRNKIDVNIEEQGATGPGGPTLFIFVPQKKTTTGWFGQVNFKLTPQWELQTGVRYSTFKVDGTGYVSLLLPTPVCGIIGLPAEARGCGVSDASGAEQDGRATGKVALNYKPDENNLLYAFVARGYKQGGFNSRTSTFDPETVLDYELGWKASLLERHVTTQLGGFYYNYHNFQFQTLNLTNGLNGVQNLPTADIYGVEGSLQAQMAGWQAELGASYVHSNQPSPGPFVNGHLLPPGVQGPQCAPGETTGCFDYTSYLHTGSSGPNLYSPKWTANAGVQYTLRVGGTATLTPRLNYAYLSGQFTSLTYSTVTDYLPARGLLSAFLTFDVGEHWSAEAFGTNLADKVYRTGQGGSGANYYFYGAPRQFGARLRYRF